MTPGFRDARSWSEMWQAAGDWERALVLAAPALLVIAVVVGGGS